MKDNLPPVIGIYSPIMQSGKSTIAKHLVAKYGYKRLSFAAPLKNMIRLLLTHIEGPERASDMVFDEELKNTTLEGFPKRITPRYLMQTLGTEWGRQLIHPELWVRAATAAMNREPGNRWVFDDMRFSNELATIKAKGGEAWRVERKSLATPENAAHMSEGQLNNYIFNANLTNDGTIEELQATVDDILWRPKE